MKSRIFAAFASLCISISAFADEGMWMVTPGSNIADAVVSLDFGCSGSIISNKGLIITNHHCAYSDVFSLSTEEHNYLENGFWAFDAASEVNIPGKCVQFLRAFIDVTDEAHKVLEENNLEGKPMGGRRLSHLMEKKYSEETGLEASLSSMWAGSRYYMALYEEYRDIRLVAAPPVSIAAFGGDEDNWEWPQQKCDFAMYRIYAAPDGSPADYSPENVPLDTPVKLNISLEGLQPGDSTFVYGYPGRTDRYSSSAKLNYQMEVTLPIVTEIRGGEMKIMSAHMNADPSVRLKYSDRYFSLSNVQELEAGELLCYGRFNVLDRKKAVEKELSEWINSSESNEYDTLLEDLDRTYDAVRDASKNLTVYRETLIRSSRIAISASRLHSHTKDARDRMVREYADLDMATERDIFRYSLEKYYTGVDSCLWGPYQKSLYYSLAGDFDAICDSLWNSSVLSDYGRAMAFAASDDDIEGDPLYSFYTDVKTSDFSSKVSEAEGDKPMILLNREYTRALYEMRLEKGIPQYPDANSTMRMTYGTVSSSLQSFDGNTYDWYSTPSQIIAKDDPSRYDFCLRKDWKKLLKKHKWGRYGKPMYVDFITDNDITGGNSGSPVLNSAGELVGLAFDGNKESLASDASFTEDFNKCVCVDIRFALWTLDKYAGMDRILREIGL